MKQLLAVILSIAVLSVGTPRMAHAEWNPGEMPLDPVLHAWFVRQHSLAGAWCCSEADGSPAQSWGIEGDHYVVTVYGKTFSVPHDALITEPNRMNEAVVWTEPLGSKNPTSVRCFAPGAAG